MAKRSKATKDDLAGIPDPANGPEFDALTDADKEKLCHYYETHPKLTGLRKPTKAEQKRINAEVDADRKKRGRPPANRKSALNARCSGE